MAYRARTPSDVVNVEIVNPNSEEERE